MEGDKLAALIMAAEGAAATSRAEEAARCAQKQEERRDAGAGTSQPVHRKHWSHVNGFSQTTGVQKGPKVEDDAALSDQEWDSRKPEYSSDGERDSEKGSGGGSKGTANGVEPTSRLREDGGTKARQKPWVGAKWTADEDEILLDYVEKFGPTSWGSVTWRSNKPFNRGAEACKKRWSRLQAKMRSRGAIPPGPPSKRRKKVLPEKKPADEADDQEMLDSSTLSPSAEGAKGRVDMDARLDKLIDAANGSAALGHGIRAELGEEMTRNINKFLKHSEGVEDSKEGNKTGSNTHGGASPAAKARKPRGMHGKERVAAAEQGVKQPNGKARAKKMTALPTVDRVSAKEEPLEVKDCNADEQPDSTRGGGRSIIDLNVDLNDVPEAAIPPAADSGPGGGVAASEHSPFPQSLVAALKDRARAPGAHTEVLEQQPYAQHTSPRSQGVGCIPYPSATGAMRPLRPSATTLVAHPAPAGVGASAAASSWLGAALRGNAPAGSLSSLLSQAPFSMPSASVVTAALASLGSSPPQGSPSSLALRPGFDAGAGAFHAITYAPPPGSAVEAESAGNQQVEAMSSPTHPRKNVPSAALPPALAASLLAAAGSQGDHKSAIQGSERPSYEGALWGSIRRAESLSDHSGVTGEKGVERNGRKRQWQHYQQAVQASPRAGQRNHLSGDEPVSDVSEAATVLVLLNNHLANGGVSSREHGRPAVANGGACTKMDSPPLGELQFPEKLRLELLAAVQRLTGKDKVEVGKTGVGTYSMLCQELSDLKGTLKAMRTERQEGLARRLQQLDEVAVNKKRIRTDAALDVVKRIWEDWARDCSAIDDEMEKQRDEVLRVSQEGEGKEDEMEQRWRLKQAEVVGFLEQQLVLAKTNQ